ncbi:N-acetylmuramoyl-L-alanine amidase [Selenomonas ruminantium]|uniref:N-acetylmuramoyl-L-alanine amidase n=1 Tax=Selenomonas ruminantium TaxID=971 RepID=A0A1H0R1Q4_SELRU|nr:N-acetylmuramoyl-L-alanine amidase [Selenomonas ruminantium]SDP23407.1 N-acetylmuramoyl-L-alanine amidase [Selenomonas ruminantium]
MKRLFFLLYITALAVVFPFAALTAEASDFGDRVSSMAEITGIRDSSDADKTRIVIDASKPVTYKKMVLSAPDRVVIDIANAWVSPKLDRQLDLDTNFVGTVKIAQFDPQTVRVVVETKVGRNNYKVFGLNSGTVPGRIVMDFGNLTDSSGAKIDLPEKTPAAKPKAETVKPKSAKQEQAQKQEKKEPEKSKDPTNKDEELDEELAGITGLKGRKIVLDPGHGGSDSGAIGPTGVMEKSVTLRVANEVRRLLVKEGATVYMTREADIEVSPKRAKATDIEELQARCDVANEVNADIFVSIHMDSFTNRAAKGTTGYYYSLGDKRSRVLADKIRSGVIDQIGTQSRGTQSCNFYVVKHTDMPATLLEVAFISNEQEEKLLDSEDGIRKAAQGIVDGIADYFG